MRQVTVLSFIPAVRDKEIHVVFHFPEQGRPQRLKVVGSVLAQVTEFIDGPFTATRHVIETAFIYEDKVVLGTDYMDSPSVIAVPAGWADEARAVEKYERRRGA